MHGRRHFSGRKGTGVTSVLTRLNLERPVLPVLRPFPNLGKTMEGICSLLLAHGASISPAIDLKARAGRACVYDDSEATRGKPWIDNRRRGH